MSERPFRSPSSRRIAAGILIGIPVSFFACTPGARRAPLAGAPAPGRDEVAVWTDYRLSVSAYEILRQTFPTLAPRDVVRLGLLAQWLERRPPSPGRRALALAESARCVRAIVPPEPPASDRREAEASLERVAGIESLAKLRSLTEGAWNGSGGATLNPDLARDYGI